MGLSTHAAIIKVGLQHPQRIFQAERESSAGLEMVLHWQQALEMELSPSAGLKMMQHFSGHGGGCCSGTDNSFNISEDTVA